MHIMLVKLIFFQKTTGRITLKSNQEMLKDKKNLMKSKEKVLKPSETKKKS